MKRPKPSRSRYEKLMADLLFLKVRESGRKLRDLSRALGRAEDDLARILKGYKKLELGDVYEVLAELGLSPESFFEQYHRLLPLEADPEDHELVPSKNRRVSRERLLRTMEETLEAVLSRSLAQLQTEPAEPGTDPPTPSPQQAPPDRPASAEPGREPPGEPEKPGTTPPAPRRGNGAKQ